MSKQINDGGSAFPQIGTEYKVDTGNRETACVAEGMSLRDYFAAKAMQALIASPNFEVKSKPHQVAELAYSTADAMVSHRAA